MNDNLYAPPLSAVEDIAPRLVATEFYAVSARKFLLLFFATFGLYQFYWFYLQWARYRRARKQPLWPVARAFFSIFFTHSLAEEIDHVARRQKSAYQWSPWWAATGYVTATIASAVLDRLSANSIGSPSTDVAALLMLVPIGLCLLALQRAANVACGQPDGAKNSTLTWANWVWLVLGGLLWLVVLLGLVVLFLPADLAQAAA